MLERLMLVKMKHDEVDTTRWTIEITSNWFDERDGFMIENRHGAAHEVESVRAACR
jgi:hypothetical protein